MTEVEEENVMKILVATDIHLGYCEKDPVRGEDSFNAFEEVLVNALAYDVDFILLGGDLFHDATPSQNAMHKCISLLRSHCLGDKPILIEFLSDQTANFCDSLNQTVNYQDPNLNISIPVFSIHGNHDDPSGFGRLSSLDILSTSGLVNYFGKWIDLTHIDIKPILMRKNDTQVALYGLSYINDARLARLFEEAKVTMEIPDSTTGDWFNILVLHQNRADRGRKNFVPQEILPDFLDLVVWGHEHDCQIEPYYVEKNDLFVTQPGSSVATSLAEGEALDKHCGLLRISQKKFEMVPIPLKSVRPFVFESIDLGDYIEERGLDEGKVQEKVMELVAEKIDVLIEKAKEKLTGDPKQPTLPLIRLRVLYTEEEQMFNAIRFGQKYNSRVANPMDMILLKRSVRMKKVKMEGVDKHKLDEAFEMGKGETDVRVEDIVDMYFEEADESKQLQIASSKGFSELCRRLVESNDDDAAERIVEFYKKKACEFLCENMPAEEEIEDELVRFREGSEQVYQDMLKELDKRGVKGENNVGGKKANDINDIDSDDDTPPNPVTKRAGRGAKTETSTRGARGRGRGARSGRGRGQGAAKPELDVSVTSGPKQTQLSFLQRSLRKEPISYEISSGSD